MGEVKRVKRDYSELPVDILSAIVGKLSIPSDLVWFGAVCVNWRSVLPENRKHVKLPSLLPVLLLSSSPPPPVLQQRQIRQQLQHTTQSLYSLYDGKVHDWQLKVHGNCRGSSHGWLVVVTTQNYSVRLFNPFSSLNNEIELPPTDYIIKAALSASPSSTSNPTIVDNVVVMAIHGSHRLSFCKPGEKTWTALPFECKPVVDVIYYNGLFYAILQNGILSTIEIDPLHSKLKDIKVLIKDVPSEFEFSGKTYIVESSGELLWVKRTIHYPGLWVKYFTTDVKVFKLQDQDDQSNSNWVEINTLDGRILFLGRNASISLSVADFPGCKPNCIYFTDDNEKVFTLNGHPVLLSGPHDMGVYNLEDRSFEPHYKMQTATFTPHPIWIQPTL